MTCLEILAVTSLSDSVQPSDVRGGGQPLSATLEESQRILFEEICAKILLHAYSSHSGKEVLSRQTVYEHFRG